MSERFQPGPDGAYRRIPLEPHQLLSQRTQTEDVFVLAHLGVPEVSAGEWSFEIGGLVDSPVRFTLADLHALPCHAVESVHQCAGNPVHPEIPTRRVSNVVWAGASLLELLETAGVREEASHLWTYGADSGTFAGAQVDAYLKDLPMWRIAAGDVLVAYELNGKPLPIEHGYPARLLVPGYYGTNSVKWITQMTLADHRAEGLFTTKLYNDEVAPDGTHAAPRLQPVYDIAPESVIVSPAPDAVLGLEGMTVWGWAWAANGVSHVEFSDDGGKTWRNASLGSRSQWSWQRFSTQWKPKGTGPHELMSRAFTTTGEVQPVSGKRNAIHAVGVEVKK